MSSINPLANQQVRTPADLSAPSGADRRSATAARPDEEAHEPAPEFLRLMDIIRQIPQVRQEVVGEVARRLAGGELLTPKATEETVKAILSAEMPAG